MRSGVSRVTFLSSVLAKQSKQGRPIELCIHPSMLTLPSAQWIPSQYTWAKLTIAWREQVVYIVIKPHKAVTLSCIARWLRTILKEAGIDSSIVGGHSTRGVSASAAARGGVTLEEILKVANWSLESVIQRLS